MIDRNADPNIEAVREFRAREVRALETLERYRAFDGQAPRPGVSRDRFRRTFAGAVAHFQIRHREQRKTLAHRPAGRPRRDAPDDDQDVAWRRQRLRQRLRASKNTSWGTETNLLLLLYGIFLDLADLRRPRRDVHPVRAFFDYNLPCMVQAARGFKTASDLPEGRSFRTRVQRAGGKRRARFEVKARAWLSLISSGRPAGRS